MSEFRWYVLHAYSGYEKKVADSVFEQAKKLGVSQYIEDIWSKILDQSQRLQQKLSIHKCGF